MLNKGGLQPNIKIRRKEIKKQLKDEFNEGSKGNIVKDILGFIIFFIVAVIIMPELIYYFGLKEFLPIYLPNVDMLATILTFIRGPNNIWKNLYVSDADYVFQFATQTMVNYCALIGMCYIVAERADKEGLFIGWSYAIIMAISSYLLPGYLIDNAMDLTYLKTNSMILSTISALGVVLSILYIESQLIFNFKTRVADIGKFIIMVPKALKKILQVN